MKKSLCIAVISRESVFIAAMEREREREREREQNVDIKRKKNVKLIYFTWCPNTHMAKKDNDNNKQTNK